MTREKNILDALGDRKIIRFDSVGSTNDEAKRLGLAGEAGGTIVVAAEQTAGRGRRNRTWESPRGGLWMSLIVKPDVNAGSAPPLLTIAAGVAVAEALEEIFDEAGLASTRVGIGWPNDILIQDRKVAGILCEAVFPESGPSFAVIGIGVNVNNRSSDLPHPLSETAISVAELTGNEIPIDEALVKIALALEITAEALLKDEENHSERILSQWKEMAALFGREVRIQSPGHETYSATPYDIDSAGRLLVRDKAGKEITVEFEETTLVR